jgi:hypothetical protein
MYNNKLNINSFNLSKLNINPPIVMIAKRNTGASWIIKKDRFDIEHELRVGINKFKVN